MINTYLISGVVAVKTSLELKNKVSRAAFVTGSSWEKKCFIFLLGDSEENNLTKYETVRLFLSKN